MSSGWQWHVGDSNYFCLLRPTRRRELQGLAILFYNSRWNYSPGNTTRVPLWTALYMALTSYKFSLNSFSYWNTFVRHESLAYQKGIRYPPHILYFLPLRRTNGDSTELNIITCLDKRCCYRHIEPFDWRLSWMRGVASHLKGGMSTWTGTAMMLYLNGDNRELTYSIDMVIHCIRSNLIPAALLYLPHNPNPFLPIK